MLEVRQLEFRYTGDQPGWRFDFSLARGACIAINGASGSGKSTLLNLLGGFLAADSGTISWDGQRIDSLPPWHRPFTSVFQEHNLFEHLDVQTNIGLGMHPGLRLTKDQKARISDSLASVGLAGYERRLPGDLSGGQRQRVALVRTLLRSQPVLLLDEPLTGLDDQARQGLHQLLLEQKASGSAIVLASHDSQDREVLADSQLNL
ncbi:ABC transporter [Marinobacter santoriniensis NKSG1]|uniref:ABC transporter n=1 Tax=Marinobacter santoriniensis NKSG1 TaxID=1288826 RepID=M7D7L6_9GAMM|nr:ATP-binding cassette domain-containing protein [Marinobacter santoriniensis]EMP56738.1 ABC transporter [Marinobacter santoriniensis NKSG1]